jgi:hypothetical protein
LTEGERFPPGESDCKDRMTGSTSCQETRIGGHLRKRGHWGNKARESNHILSNCIEAGHQTPLCALMAGKNVADATSSSENFDR